MAPTTAQINQAAITIAFVLFENCGDSGWTVYTQAWRKTGKQDLQRIAMAIESMYENRP
ncbi:MAG: hypothetical protein GY799_29535 [Desulfobulbaceae bacterium]|nr:hypothetical protein [Desulfobulbaceae bacterium]